MKELLAMIFLLGTCAVSFAESVQPPPRVDDKINYTEVVAVEGVGRAELYSRVKLWYAETFTLPDGLVLDDPENGVLVGKGSIEVKEGDSRVKTLFNSQAVKKTWEFTVKIQLKDGRYKVEMYAISYTFAMPGNNIGHSPKLYDLDKLFKDEEMYKRDGSLKSGAPENIANWTNAHFSELLDSLRKSLSEKVTLDDF